MTIHAFLYSADAPDRAPDFAEIELGALSEQQLLWLDLADPTPAELERASKLIGGDRDLLQVANGNHDRAALANFSKMFRVTATAVTLERSTTPLDLANMTLIAGRNYVITVHEDELPFLDDLRNREKGESVIGALAAESFVASLLDWLLGTYFRAVEVLVHDIDRVEVAILGKRVPPEFLGILVEARKRIAELRRLLKAHRDVFHALARPDFMASEQPEARPHFEALNRHYERAEDELESARDLVIGSFELIATRAAQTTNETMRTLTFVTVLMGSLALIAGVLGMNFQLPLFETGVNGFLVVTGSMIVLSAISVGIAMKRSWI
jgi:Mg2+ and Co2+ transporter CorA